MQPPKPVCRRQKARGTRWTGWIRQTGRLVDRGRRTGNAKAWQKRQSVISWRSTAGRGNPKGVCNGSRSHLRFPSRQGGHLRPPRPSPMPSANGFNVEVVSADALAHQRAFRKATPRLRDARPQSAVRVGADLREPEMKPGRQQCQETATLWSRLNTKHLLMFVENFAGRHRLHAFPFRRRSWGAA